MACRVVVSTGPAREKSGDCLQNRSTLAIIKFSHCSINLIRLLMARSTPSKSSGSGSVSRRYGSGSGFGSFHHQAKIVRKTIIFTVLCLLNDCSALKNDVNVPSNSNKQKNTTKKLFFVGVLKVTDEKTRILSRIHPYQNVIDPEHYINEVLISKFFARHTVISLTD